jgi:hypothetical protein
MVFIFYFNKKAFYMRTGRNKNDIRDKKILKAGGGSQAGLNDGKSRTTRNKPVTSDESMSKHFRGSHRDADKFSRGV